MLTGRSEPHEECCEKAVAVIRDQAWWEEIGRKGTLGQIPGFNAQAWMLVMKTRFGWSDEGSVALIRK